ncbi:hypothetical protein D918_05166 [Trichuris suis]|nr:hypothetical protein D918_05166 [Trichuris suis]
MTRKGWVEFIVRKKMEMIKEDRLHLYHGELKERQEKFLASKRRLFDEFEMEERTIRDELAAIRAEEEPKLEVAGKTLGGTVDQITENSMLHYYYIPRKVDSKSACLS